MDTQSIVAQLRQEASRIENAIAALVGLGSQPARRGRPPKGRQAKPASGRQRRRMSASARARIGAAKNAWFGMVPSRPRRISCEPCCRESCRSLATSTERSQGCLVSYEGFQRLAHDERARANGDTRTIAEAARQLECNTRSVRRLVELEWLRARPTPKAFRVTEESIAAFKKRYVSLLSIARTTNSASWALQHLCKRCNLSMLVARQPGKKRSQAFIRSELRQELLCLRSGRSLSRSR